MFYINNIYNNIEEINKIKIKGIFNVSDSLNT